MSIRRLIAAAALAACAIAPAHAATSALAGDGTWQEFAVDEFQSGTLAWGDSLDASQAITFTFTVAAGQQGTLTVVDTGFVGDMFNVFNGATLLGGTSAVPVHTYNPAETAVVDFDLALADPSFSRAVVVLGEGSYSIHGVLSQSVTDPTLGALNATTGGLKLEIAAVPEPGALLLMLTGAGAMALRRRRCA